MMPIFFRSFFRSFRSQFFYSSLNVGSLAIGLSCIIFVYSYVKFETSFDGFHANKSEVFRVVFSENTGYDNGSVLTPMVLADAGREIYPDISFVRLNNAGGARVNFMHGETKFQESAFYFTDNSFFEVFSFPLTVGNPATCLREPFTMVITERARKKYFNDASPLNESIDVEWGTTKYPIKVTGVIRDIPVNSHLQFDFLISHATAEQIFSPKSFFSDWTANFCYTYLKITVEKDIEHIGKRFNEFFTANLRNTNQFPARLQSLTHIHLHSNLKSEISKNSNVTFIYIGTILGILLLVITIVNFNSFYISLLEKRLKGIAVRRLLGAGTTNILFSIISELTLTLLLALMIALLILRSGLFDTPGTGLNQLNALLMDKNEFWIGILFISFVFFLVLISPVRLILNTNTIEVLKSGKISIGGIAIRNVFVMAQVAVSVVLITSFLLINQQLTFMKTTEMGYQMESRLIVPQGRIIRNRSEAIKTELKTIAGVKEITLSSHIPTGNLSLMIDIYPEGKSQTEKFPIAAISVDYDFFKTYAIDLKKGRLFSREYASDSLEGVILNESAVIELSWKEPVGKRIRLEFNAGDGTFEKREGTVVGVVNDVYFESMHKKVKPLIYFCKPFWFYYVTIQTEPALAEVVSSKVKDRWSKLVPEAPFEFNYLDARYEKLYEQEENWSTVIKNFTVISVLLTFGGILGIISFLLFKRRREIIIRKIHGATSTQVLIQFNRYIFTLVGLGALMSVPFGVFLQRYFSASFYYKSTLNYILIAVGALLLFGLIAIITSVKVIGSYRSTPVNGLRD